LLYCSTHCRPDIAYAVSYLAKFSERPTVEHWNGAKRVLRYLKGTVDHGLLFYATGKLTLTGDCDADWGSNAEDRRSVSGYVFMLGGAAISWKSKSQPIVALSTCEAELIGVAEAVKELLWLKQLCGELGFIDIAVPVLRSDNQAAIASATREQVTQRTKHMDIRHKFIAQHLLEGDFSIRYVPSQENIADIMTKALTRVMFASGRDLLGVWGSVEIYPLSDTPKQEAGTGKVDPDA